VGHIPASRSILACAVTAILLALLAAPAPSAQKRRKQARPKKVEPVWPAYEARRSEFLASVRGAAVAGAESPDPLTQFLVSEVIVTGIFETENGYGVFLHALPNGRTFDARPGTQLYNGRLYDIVVGPEGYMDEGTVVFVERPSLTTPERQVAKRLERAPERVPVAETPKSP
jgi:hypothetical protein